MKRLRRVVSAVAVLLSFAGLLFALPLTAGAEETTPRAIASDTTYTVTVVQPWKGGTLKFKRTSKDTITVKKGEKFTLVVSCEEYYYATTIAYGGEDVWASFNVPGNNQLTLTAGEDIKTSNGMFTVILKNIQDNWVYGDLRRGLNIWNKYVVRAWNLITMKPDEFKGGTVWKIIKAINSAMKAIGLSLLALFFVFGAMKTLGSLTELKRPEVAVKLLLRFILARTLVVYGMDLITLLFTIAQGIVVEIMNTATASSDWGTLTISIPNEIIQAIGDNPWYKQVPLWLMSFVGSLFMVILAFSVILTVYGRFFKIYMYAAIYPIPFAAFAGEPTHSIGRSFIKSFCGVLLEGAVIALAMIIFTGVATAPELTGSTNFMKVTTYIVETIFNMLLLVGTIRIADRVVREMFGI